METTDTEDGERARTPLETARDYTNPAAVKGAAALVLGLLILLVPSVSLTLVEYAVALGLTIAAVYDIAFAISGRLQGRRRSRWLAGLRALVELGGALLIVVSPYDSLIGIVALVGIYLVVRGVITTVLGLVGPDRRRRSARLTGGVASIALGVLATMAPGVLTQGLVVLGAMAAIVLGAIVLTFGLRAARADTPSYDPAIATVVEILVDWVRGADIGPARREELAGSLFFEEPERVAKYASWWVMLLLSVAIATFAVLQDSTAVVIGAMLVAPLMVPILALAGALVNGWSRRAARSALLIAGGVSASVVVSLALSAWAPVALSFDTNSQISSRVTPNLLDMLIAIAAGAAGAFATVNTRASSSIAGVAIAVALVPPLAVVGIALGAGRPADAAGAFVLFLTNFVAIVLAASVVFMLGGFVEGITVRHRTGRLWSTLAPFGALALVVLVPLVFNSQGILASATQSAQAQDAVEEWLGPGTDLRVDDLTVAADTVTVDLHGPSEPPPLEPLQESLSRELGREVGVTVSLTPVVESSLDPRPGEEETREQERLRIELGE